MVVSIGFGIFLSWKHGNPEMQIQNKKNNNITRCQQIPCEKAAPFRCGISHLPCCGGSLFHRGSTWLQAVIFQRSFPLSKHSSIEIISIPLLNELKKWNTLMLCDTCKALVWRRSRPHRLCIFVSYQSQIELNAQQLKKKIFLFLTIWMAEAFFVVLWRAGSTAPFYLYSISICSKPSRILCTSFRTSSSVKM